MRIGLDARAIGPHFPGIGRATLGLLHGLSEVEHDERIVVYYHPAHRLLIEQTGVAADGRFTLVPVAVGPFEPRQQWRLPRLAQAAHLDLWHAPYYLRPFSNLPPVVVTVFDTIGPTSDGQPPRPLASIRARLLWQLSMRLSLRGAARVVTSSAAAKRDLETQFVVPPERLIVIPLAADRQFQPASAAEVASIRHEHDLPERYALYLGSNKPHKNLVALIDAWSTVVGDVGPETSQPALVIAGREDSRYPAAPLRAAALGLDTAVRFLPDVADSDLPALLTGALIFVFPSLHEGFGLPPLEAMACGAPVISSNRPSLPEVVADAGLLVEPTPAALAAAMRRLMSDDDLRGDLRVRGLARASQFSWKRTAAETLRVYRQVAG